MATLYPLSELEVKSLVLFHVSLTEELEQQITQMCLIPWVLMVIRLAQEEVTVAVILNLFWTTGPFEIILKPQTIFEEKCLLLPNFVHINFGSLDSDFWILV